MVQDSCIIALLQKKTSVFVSLFIYSFNFVIIIITTVGVGLLCFDRGGNLMSRVLPTLHRTEVINLYGTKCGSNMLGIHIFSMNFRQCQEKIVYIIASAIA